MSVYAIGDIQGCLGALQQLLDKIHFDPAADEIWFCGDLVNRGPDSLGTLRFVRSLHDHAISVLGNHDLHLLAAAEGIRKEKDPGMQAILHADDRDELLDWLRHRPLMHRDTTLDFMIVHAGVPPQWDGDDIQRHSQELEATLQGDHYVDFLRHMYGNAPEKWNAELQGWDRLRFICNAFTRMRYCYPDGRLELKANGTPGTQPKEALPWFEVAGRKSVHERILFGHWSTLGPCSAPNVFSLDTGCVWGGQLTALQLDSDPPRYYRIECEMAKKPKKGRSN